MKDFEFDDFNQNLLDRAKTSEHISPINKSELIDEISTQMEEASLEFRAKQNESVISASKTFLTF